MYSLSNESKRYKFFIEEDKPFYCIYSKDLSPKIIDEAKIMFGITPWNCTYFNSGKRYIFNYEQPSSSSDKLNTTDLIRIACFYWLLQLKPPIEGCFYKKGSILKTWGETFSNKTSHYLKYKIIFGETIMSDIDNHIHKLMNEYFPNETKYTLLNIKLNDIVKSIGSKDFHIAHKMNKFIISGSKTVSLENIVTKVKKEFISFCKLSHINVEMLKCKRGGIIPYIKVSEDKNLFLFGIDSGYGQYSDFGGSVESVDKNIIETACREFKEESLETIEIDKEELKESYICYDTNTLIIFYKISLDNMDKIITEYNMKVVNVKSPEMIQIAWLNEEQIYEYCNTDFIYYNTRVLLYQIFDQLKNL